MSYSCLKMRCGLAEVDRCVHCSYILHQPFLLSTIAQAVVTSKPVALHRLGTRKVARCARVQIAFMHSRSKFTIIGFILAASVKMAPVVSLEQRACLSYATVAICVCRWLLTDGAVIPVSLIAVVPTVQGKSVFYGYLSAASVSVGLPTQFVHCCLVTARGFIPSSLIVIPYTILEILKFLGQLPVDDDDDEKCKFNDVGGRSRAPPKGVNRSTNRASLQPWPIKVCLKGCTDVGNFSWLWIIKKQAVFHQ